MLENWAAALALMPLDDVHSLKARDTRGRELSEMASQFRASHSRAGQLKLPGAPMCTQQWIRRWIWTYRPECQAFLGCDCFHKVEFNSCIEMAS